MFENWSWSEGPPYPELADGAVPVAISHSAIMACGGFDRAAWLYHKRCYKARTRAYFNRFIRCFGVRKYSHAD